MRFNRAKGIALAIASAAVAGLAASGTAKPGPTTSVQPYAVSLSADYDVTPIWSVGDQVPVTGDPSRTYQMVGIPDGIGVRANNKGELIVYMNHEFTSTTLSEPYVGEDLNRGAIVTRAIVSPTGVVLSAKRAYDKVYLDDTFVGPAADTSNATPGFGRFCSGSMAGRAEGFTGPIYFANEESGAPGVFDGLGGLSVAIFEDEAHALTYLGRFPWEQTMVQPGTGNATVIFGMEDGPADLDPLRSNSQIYLYVGAKDPSGTTTLQKNGLVGGKLYVMKAINPAKNSESLFTSGSIEVEWVEIPNANTLTEAQLEAASDVAGAMTFARPEDCAFNPRNHRNLIFVTTGGAAGANDLGRIYSLRLNKNSPTGHALLTLVVNADTTVAAGGDTALSPDNIDVNGDYLFVQEDGTTQSRAVMAAKSRDGSIWRFALTGSLGFDPLSAERIVELDPPGRDGTAVNPGVWETSGIVAADAVFGAGSLIFDVQAHSPTKAPFANTVEDGQLMLLIKK